jgi:Virulence factor membrane-bound polymerase, C-terminal/O-Antigen ligase/Protein glycosylation ligase
MGLWWNGSCRIPPKFLSLIAHLANNQTLCSTKKERFLPLFFFEAMNRYWVIAGCIFYVLSFVVPNHYVPWLTFYNDILAFTALLFLVAAYTAKDQQLTLNYLPLLIFSIALIPIFQFAFGTVHFFGDALMASMYVFGFGAAVFLGGCIATDKNKEKILISLAALTIFAAIISVFMGMYQWLELSGLGVWIIDMRPGGRPFANLAQPNNFSTLLCIALVSLIYLWERKTLGVGVVIVLTVILIFGIALAHSRTAWVAGGVFIAWWLWKRDSVSLRLGWVPVLAGLFLYTLFLFSLPVISEHLGLPGDTVSEGMAVGARGLIWQQLLDAVMRGPIWGYGWNQVSLAQISVVSEYPGSLYVADSHNLFLDLMVWSGPVLGIFISMGIIYWGVKSAIKCKSLEVWFCLSCIGFFAVHAMLELPHAYAYLLLPVGVLVGVVNAERHQDQKIVGCPKWVLFPLVVVGVCLLMAVFSEYRKIEEDARLLRFESRGIGPLKAEIKAPDVVLLTQLRDFLAFGRTKASSGMSDTEVEWMGDVAHRYPLSSSLFRYISALALNSKFDEARLELERLKNLYGDEIYQEAITNLKLIEAGDLQLDFERVLKPVQE